MFFKDIIGNRFIADHLRTMVRNNRLPHALLLHGNEGSGALPMALALAQYLNCTNRTQNDACGSCPSCLKYKKLIHPDLHFVYPIVKNDKRTLCDDYIYEWRLFLQEHQYGNLNYWLEEMHAANKQGTIYTEEGEKLLHKLGFKPYESDYKTIIIWLPERMQTVCANKILKILEEPASFTHFILVSEEPEQVLGTILSRTQSVYIPNPFEKEIAAQLQQDYTLAPTDAARIAHLANGNYLKALEIMSTGEGNTQMLELFITLMRLSYARNLIKLKEWSETTSKLGRETLKQFFAYAQNMIRENFIYNLQMPAANYMTDKEATFSQRFAPFIHERNVEDLNNELEKAEIDIENNVNSKIVLFDLALKITVLLKRK